MLELAATAQPRRGSRIQLPLAQKEENTPTKSSSPRNGEQRMLAPAPQQQLQPSAVAVWQAQVATASLLKSRMLSSASP